MKFTITWKDQSVRIDYSGAIDNQDIESAHFELNTDDRFYECKSLVINITDCDLEKVSVPDLKNVVALEIGAAYTNKDMKVAMVANNPVSIDKASNYISLFQFHESPWEFQIFNTLNDAYEWLKLK